MYNKLIILSVLQLIFVATALCELSGVTQIPASQDVYFCMDNETVYSDADILRCEVNVSEINGSRTSSYSGVPMMQFDISGLNITGNDIGILVLKAASIEKQSGESAMVAMMPMGSSWDENSSYVEFVMNLLPIWNIVKNNDIAQMGISTDGDGIFAFDVSKRLREAKADEDRVSFLLMAISNSSYRVDFKSSESGEGPYLMVMPYPAGLETDKTSVPLSFNESMTNQTAVQVPENSVPPADQSTITSTPLNESMIKQKIIDQTTKKETPKLPLKELRSQLEPFA